MTVDLYDDNLTVEDARTMTTEHLERRLRAIQARFRSGAWASESGCGSEPAIYTVLWERRRTQR